MNHGKDCPLPKHIATLATTNLRSYGFSHYICPFYETGNDQTSYSQIQDTMRQREVFYKYPAALQLLYFVAICIGCILISSNLASLAVILLGGMDKLAATSSLLFIQAFSAIGGFLVPALWLAWMKKAGETDFLHASCPISPLHLSCGLVILLLSSPLVSALQEWGQSWPLGPGLESFFGPMTSRSEAILDQMLHVDSWLTFLMSFLVIAVVAGICEEFLFRGGLQNLLKEWFKSGHAAVWVTAIVFSAVHLDPAGFLPRCLLGAILGYAYLYSGSIWVPVILHIINNGFSCLIEFCYYKGYSRLDPDILSQSLGTEWTLVSIAGLIFFAIFLFRYRKLKRELQDGSAQGGEAADADRNPAQ